MSTEFNLIVTPSQATCGAIVRGVDLARPQNLQAIASLRKIWLKHQVIGFPDQALSITDLERVAQYFGPHGEDPFIEAITDHPHVIEVKREADETTPLFAESWHSDWSFLKVPPAGTALYGTEIPPVGGDTLFADQYAAYDALPGATKSKLQGLVAIHSARRGYSPDGLYGTRDLGRSMAIRWSDAALKTQQHPLVRHHPETGKPTLFISAGYTIGIQGMAHDAASELLLELFAHQVKEEFVYRHRWSRGMLTIWDNRCLLHAATGGYQGYRRHLYRVTIAEMMRET